VSRPAKSLQTRLRDGSFVARKHHRLLAGPLVGEDRLRSIQRAYQAATSEPERRALVLDFQEEAHRGFRGTTTGTVAPGDRVAAVLPVADFFERNLRHQKGPAAGQPFVLEPWQRELVDELYRVDERGNRIYKRAILGVPPRNGKSPLAAWKARDAGGEMAGQVRAARRCGGFVRSPEGLRNRFRHGRTAAVIRVWVGALAFALALGPAYFFAISRAGEDVRVALVGIGAALLGSLVGGTLTGWVSLASEDKRQAFASKQEERRWSREDDQRQKDVRGVARLLDGRYRQARTSLATAANQRSWWVIDTDVPERLSSEDMKLLGSWMDDRSWAKIQAAETVLLNVEIFRQEAKDRGGNNWRELVDEEKEILELARETLNTAIVTLSALTGLNREVSGEPTEPTPHT
jgi:hypothetical protein